MIALLTWMFIGPPDVCNEIAYCVPDLQLDGLVGRRDDFRAELDADGGVVIKLELFLQELQQHAAFAHTFLIRWYVLVSPMIMYLKR